MKPHATRGSSILALALGVALSACTTSGGVGIVGILPEDLGTVQVSITGLPTAQAANVKVTGPRGYTVDVPYTRTVSGLPRGTYTVSAQTVTVGGVPYTPTTTGNPAVIERNAQTVQIQIAYAPPPTGQLALNVAGLPDGVTSPVHLTGPNGYDRTLNASGSLTIADLEPGTYQIGAPAVVQPGMTYTPSVQGAPATIEHGKTSTVNVSYSGAPNVGSLSVLLTGLPEGAAPSLSVSGPGGSNRALTGSGIISNLDPGSYTVTYSSIVFDGFNYAPASTAEIVTVAEGQTAQAGTAYAATTGKVMVYVNAPINPADGTTLNVPANHITLSGPSGFSRGMNASTLLENVAIGAYSANAPDVIEGSWTYRSTIAPSSVNAQAGKTIAISIVYAPKASNPEVGTDITPPQLTITDSNLTSMWGTALDENGVGSVEIYDGVVYLGHAYLGANGAWSFELPALEDGEHRFTVFAIDPHGNESSATHTMIVDQRK